MEACSIYLCSDAEGRSCFAAAPRGAACAGCFLRLLGGRFVRVENVLDEDVLFAVEVLKGVWEDDRTLA